MIDTVIMNISIIHLWPVLNLNIKCKIRYNINIMVGINAGYVINESFRFPSNKKIIDLWNPHPGHSRSSVFTQKHSNIFFLRNSIIYLFLYYPILKQSIE